MGRGAREEEERERERGGGGGEILRERLSLPKKHVRYFSRCHIQRLEGGGGVTKRGILKTYSHTTLLKSDPPPPCPRLHYPCYSRKVAPTFKQKYILKTGVG